MLRPILVRLLPTFFESADLRDGVAVVIDVLRASSTIIHALAGGAASVVPCSEIDEARAMAKRFPPGSALLGGERGGLKIAGFDLGNSPGEYNQKVVAGRCVVFT